MLSYKPLWKTLLEKDMKKSDLGKQAGISTATVAKLGKNENVNTEILDRICQTLSCKIEEVVEFVPDEQ